MVRNTVTWIHLSDLHAIGKGNITTELTIDMLLEDIKNETSKLGEKFGIEVDSIDLMIFTGDVSFSGRNKEYQEAWENFFKPLLKTLNLKEDKVFIVPGNHDLYRGAANNEKRRELVDKLKNGTLDLRDIESALNSDEESFFLLFSPYK